VAHSSTSSPWSPGSPMDSKASSASSAPGLSPASWSPCSSRSNSPRTILETQQAIIALPSRHPVATSSNAVLALYAGAAASSSSSSSSAAPAHHCPPSPPETAPLQLPVQALDIVDEEQGVELAIAIAMSLQTLAEQREMEDMQAFYHSHVDSVATREVFSPTSIVTFASDDDDDWDTENHADDQSV
jgi:hypothetical protein